ncbi:RcnB family protein [Novosphingobium sp.]|jgi:Ni/Co efflux regulator RcnB|uniref:RcnB family protein n=1 Tax=Novosphingobium sp. TaxID=1874826 RepID=UPI002FDFC7E4
MKFAYLAFVPLLLAPEGILPLEFAAMAQQNRPDGSHGQSARPPGGGGSGGANRPGQPGGGRPTNPGAGSNRPQPAPQPVPQPQPTRPGGNHGQPGRPGAGNDHRPPQGGYRPGQPGANRAGRPGTFRPMRAPAYRYPRGYTYRRWSINMMLPAIFLSSSYLFQDYGMIGVGPPPAGYYWVRYGPDLLLVNRRSRRVVDVIYGAFY